jgi:hypothetical protein
MNSASNSITALKEMIALEEKRITLQDQLNAIEQRVSALRSSVIAGRASTAASTTTLSATGAKGSPSGKGTGTYRDYIMAALESAGSVGLRVKDLAIALKTKPVNIHSWFHSNLKRIPSIVKVSGGHYRIAGGSRPANVTPSAPKTRKKRTGTKRGALTASILENLRAAGARGIKIADLADKLGANYKNIYIWFATTGKKHTGIKRIAPATFRLTS